MPERCTGVSSAVPGKIWKILVEVGTPVVPGQTIAIIESMKMEIDVPAPGSGRIREVRGAPGRAIRQGDIIAVIEHL